MKLRIHGAAEEEGRDRVRWYATREVRVAERLEALLVTAIEQIARDPLQFPLLEIRKNPGNLPRVRIPKFPLIVIYQVLSEDVLVVAIAHTSQRPGYWRRRLKK